MTHVPHPTSNSNIQTAFSSVSVPTQHHANVLGASEASKATPGVAEASEANSIVYWWTQSLNIRHNYMESVDSLFRILSARLHSAIVEIQFKWCYVKVYQWYRQLHVYITLLVSPKCYYKTAMSLPTLGVLR